MQSILPVSLFIFSKGLLSMVMIIIKNLYKYTFTLNHIIILLWFLFIVMDSNVSKLNEDPLRWYMYQTTVKLIKDLNKILCVKHE